MGDGFAKRGALGRISAESFEITPRLLVRRLRSHVRKQHGQAPTIRADLICLMGCWMLSFADAYRPLKNFSQRGGYLTIKIGQK